MVRKIAVRLNIFSTGINLAASLQWVAAMPQARYTEYCTRDSPFLRDLVVNRPRVEDGLVAIPQGPGLGIEVNEEVIERYRV
jgi:L-alanine-DL-glutamate epimerase-like enolase superfamily enzyme